MDAIFRAESPWQKSALSECAVSECNRDFFANAIKIVKVILIVIEITASGLSS